jgi:dipeptidyl aminopeptidase/acylaminoacyl peptidase
LKEIGFFLLQRLNPVAFSSRAAAETGILYAELEEMNTKAFEKMKKCSPITYVSNVVAPTLLLVGSKDRRVPSSQGIHYYYRLHSNNVKTKYADYFCIFICTLKIIRDANYEL